MMNNSRAAVKAAEKEHNNPPMVNGDCPFTEEEALRCSKKMEDFFEHFRKDFRYTEILGTKVRIQGFSSLESSVQSIFLPKLYSLARRDVTLDDIVRSYMKDEGIYPSSFRYLKAAAYWYMWQKMSKRAKFLVNSVVTRKMSATQLSYQQIRLLWENVSTITIPAPTSKNCDGYFKCPAKARYAVAWLDNSDDHLIIRDFDIDDYEGFRSLKSLLDTTGVHYIVDTSWYGTAYQVHEMLKHLMDDKERMVRLNSDMKNLAE